MKNLIPALIKARAEFLPIKKDAVAYIGKRPYNYATLDSIIEATTPALSKFGLYVVNTMEHDGGNRVLVCSLWHESGEYIESKYILPPSVNSRELGSAITYGRRYSLTAILNINLEDDLDGATYQSESVSQQPSNASYTAQKPASQTFNSSHSAAPKPAPKPAPKLQIPEPGPGSEAETSIRQNLMFQIDQLIADNYIEKPLARSLLQRNFEVRSRSMLNISQLQEFLKILHNYTFPVTDPPSLLTPAK